MSIKDLIGKKTELRSQERIERANNSFNIGYQGPRLDIICQVKGVTFSFWDDRKIIGTTTISWSSLNDSALAELRSILNIKNEVIHFGGSLFDDIEESLPVDIKLNLERCLGLTLSTAGITTDNIITFKVLGNSNQLFKYASNKIKLSFRYSQSVVSDITLSVKSIRGRADIPLTIDLDSIVEVTV